MTPTLFLLAGLSVGVGLERPDVEFQIFQFPANQIPRIDGDTADWSIVPDSYTIGTSQHSSKLTSHFRSKSVQTLSPKYNVGFA